MRQLIYDVACSADGFIAHADGSIAGFEMHGDVLADYQARLLTYETVVMGRSTYEFGYDYGLKPGTRAYPHMRHYIFSKTLPFESSDAVHVVRGEAAPVIASLKAEAGPPIYLCGGGAFAASLLRMKAIDRLILKVNPLVLGRGIALFAGSSSDATPYYRLDRVAVKLYDSGVTLATYDVRYDAGAG